MKFVRIIFLMLFIVSIVISLSGCKEKNLSYSPKAVKGVLDLKDWNFDKNGEIEIDGEWEYYSKILLEPKDFNSGNKIKENVKYSKLEYLNNDESFSDIRRKMFNPQQYGTYRIKIIVKPSFFELNNIIFSYSGFKIWIDDELIDSVGNTIDGEIFDVDNIKHGFTAQNEYEFISQKEEFYITLQSIRSTSSLILSKQGQNDLKNEKKIYFLICIVSMILIIGCYHLILFFIRRKDYSTLYFSIMCFSICLLQITSSFINFTYNSGLNILIGWLVLKFGVLINILLWNLSIVLLMVTVKLFLNELFNNIINYKINNLLKKLYYLIILVMSIQMYYFYENKFIYTNFMDVLLNCIIFLYALIILYIIILAVYRKIANSIVIFVGMLVLVVTVIIDMLSSIGVINADKIIFIGMIVLILSQSYAIAKNFSNAFIKVELLSNRLISLDKLKDEFIANTSHEIRTPLNGITGIAENMLDGSVGELNNNQKYNISLILTSGKRLSALIGDVLDFSKLKYKELNIVKKDVDIKPLIDVVIEVSKTLVKDKKIEIFNNVPVDIAYVYGDENRLQQILYNLIGNAVKFTKEGSIKINAKQLNNEIEISVEDTGIGIEKEKQKKIFESFEQVDSSMEREYGGTGLGLSITKNLIELHDGKISVESEPERGSKFIFTLPVSKNKKKAAQVTENEVKIIDKLEPEIISKMTDVPFDNTADMYCEKSISNILIVEDEEINQQVILNQLKSNRYRLKIASNGQEALNIIENSTENFDLAIVDVMMPKMSGYELTKKIREKYSLFELPILILTAKTMTEDIIASFASGSNDYLSKPFEKTELLTRAKTLITLKKLVYNSIDKEKELVEEQLSREHAESYAKQQEEYNLRLNDTIDELNAALDELSKTQDYLIQSEKMASMGQLVGGIIHNVNTPIMSISGAVFGIEELINEYNESVLDKSVTADDHKEIANEMSKWIKSVKENLEYISKMVSIVKGQIVKSSNQIPQTFTMEEVIEKVELLLDFQIRNSGCKLNVVNKSGKKIKIYGEISTLIQVIDNLVINAVHAYGENSGQIEITVNLESNNIIISVSDNAGGIPESIKDSLFKEMITTKGRDGSGLGLYLSYSNVKARLKGDMWFETKEGLGTVFYISIPISI